jgi:hypothetical protein
MKYTAQIFIHILALISLLSACQVSEKEEKHIITDDIKITAQNYAKSMADKDFENAEKYTAESFSKEQTQASEEIKTRISKQFSNFSLDTVIVRATGTYYHDKEKHHIQLAYTNKGWKVIPDKDIFRKGPQAVAAKFLSALNNQDYDKAKKLGTESTVQMLTMIESMAGMAPEGEDLDMGADMDSIEWGDVEIDGDEAVVHYTLEGSKEKMDLVKQDGKWKVDMKKEM